jgi:hypothetical protein
VYGLTVGEINNGGQTSLASRPYDDAWDALLRISTGAEAVIARVRQLHRPVEHRGVLICAACSGWDGSTTDNSPCGYEHCPTLKLLGARQVTS